MNVRDLVRHVRSVEPGDDPRLAADIMRDEGVGVVPVASNGYYLGVVAESDLSGNGQPLHTITRQGVPQVPADMSTQEALALFDGHGLPALPVVETDGRIVGVVRRADLVSPSPRLSVPRMVGGMAE